MPKNNSKAMREARAEQAQTRQAQRDERTAQEQIALLDHQGHAATKERARLNKEAQQ